MYVDVLWVQEDYRRKGIGSKLLAEAEKEAISRIIEALSTKGHADKYLIAMKYLDTMKEMTSGKDNKIVYMPYEASAVLSSVDGIKEMLINKKGA
jgi:GNAT superfamily N-acetyltransferase